MYGNDVVRIGGPPGLGQRTLSIRNDEDEEVGGIIIDAGQPGFDGIEIRVERQDEAETGPVRLVVE